MAYNNKNSKPIYNSYGSLQPKNGNVTQVHGHNQNTGLFTSECQNINSCNGFFYERRSGHVGKNGCTGVYQSLNRTGGSAFGHYLHPSEFSLHNYELIRTIGTGTFGRVYLCRLRPTGQHFAMKILKKSDVVRLRQEEHIKSEKDILSCLNFPFIVKLYTTYQDKNRLFMLMELVIGGEVFSFLRRVGVFKIDMARFYCAEIVLALEHLHMHSIIYRDLKPENILLDENGHLKITDFGFSKKILDKTWTVCGTPEYLAPEIIQVIGHDCSADWWALGVLLFEMLVGYPPFFGDTHLQIYEKITKGIYTIPHHINPLAKDLITRLLVVDKTKRLGSSKNGVCHIKRHPFFTPIKWDLLLTKQLPPPHVPKLKSYIDTSNFEVYEEITIDTFDYNFNNADSQQFNDMFRDF